MISRNCVVLRGRRESVCRVGLDGDISLVSCICEDFSGGGMRLNGPQHAIKLLMMLSKRLSSSFRGWNSWSWFLFFFVFWKNHPPLIYGCSEVYVILFFENLRKKGSWRMFNRSRHRDNSRPKSPTLAVVMVTRPVESRKSTRYARNGKFSNTQNNKSKSWTNSWRCRLGWVKSITTINQK